MNLWTRLRADPFPCRTSSDALSVSFLLCSSLSVLIRRIAVGQGFSGYLASHEVYFIILDALLMVLCLIVLAFSHPLFTLMRLASPSKSETTSVSELTAEKTSSV